MDLPTNAFKAAICVHASHEVPTRSPRSSAQPEKQAADHPETTAIATGGHALSRKLP